MKTYKFKDENEWLDARRGKITGTKAKGILPKSRGAGRRVEFYNLIAERVAVPADLENVMDRGKRLEEQAIEEFEKKTKKKIDNSLVIWQREDFPEIALSPDGFTSDGKEAVEVKCLASGRHIEAWLTEKIPTEYESQVIQYFVVNDKLETLHFVFYDPRMPKPIFWIDIDREDLEDKIEEYFEAEKSAIEEIKKIEKELTF